jgi:uncharacterized protein (UPF0332 family)
VSAAYYSLFHLLVEDAARMLVTDTSLRHLVARAFAHADMKQASQAFATGNLPPHVRAVTGAAIPAELRSVAATLVDRQAARHEADYRLSRTFTRGEVTNFVHRARQAHDAWKIVRGHPLAKVYLASLLLWNKWKR